MLIEIHAIQNHSPSNLNRDDLGAPKTCYFGGVMRSRISSQCIKRSIRTSEQFKLLCGGKRTRRLPQYLADQIKDKQMLALADAVVQHCGLNKDKDATKAEKKDVIVFLSSSAVVKMVALLRGEAAEVKKDRVAILSRQFAELVANDRFAPDMALFGRMLEPAKPQKAAKATGENVEKGADDGVWKGLDLSIEAASQVAHAISTHEARPEVDYFVAADNIPGDNAGGAHIGEAMFGSACFYKYFSIHWETLVANLAGREPDVEKEANAHAKWTAETKPRAEQLAAHTVGAFLRGAALTNPTGKQNSFAAHNPPDGIVVEFKDTSPVSYANAFATPVPCKGPRNMVSQSIAQLGRYVHDLDVGYGEPRKRFWFSPNLRYKLAYLEDSKEKPCAGLDESTNVKALGDLVAKVVKEIGFDWGEVKKVAVCEETSP